ncbi:hypothetical protein D3C71_1395670 [compost metagenome]
MTISLDSLLPDSLKNSSISVLEGELALSSGVVSISSAELEEILRLDIGKDTAKIQVFVNELAHPNEVWIEAK